MPKVSYFTLVLLPAKRCHLFQRRVTCDNNVEPLSFSLLALVAVRCRLYVVRVHCFAVTHLSSRPRPEWLGVADGSARCDFQQVRSFFWFIFPLFVRISSTVNPVIYYPPKTRCLSEWWVAEWAALMRATSVGQQLSVGRKTHGTRNGVALFD